jgi:hypothetical protein
MKHKQTEKSLRDTILKAASVWLAEKQSPFAVVEEFASFVGKSSVIAPPPESLLAGIFACGFPCVRGDKGERVLWLRPAASGSSSCLPFVPSEAVRQFAAALPKAEAEAA